MSKWIVRQADRIKGRTARTPGQQRHCDRMRQLVLDRWAETSQATLSAVSSDIASFNAQFDEAGRHITFERHGPDFSARREDDDRTREIRMTLSDACITLRVTWVEPAYGAATVVEDVLPFGVSDSSTAGLLIHGQSGTPAETAERLLLHLF